jgi:predicted nucleotidyltransferase
MTVQDKDLLVARELRGRLADVSPVVDFRLFGSRARGNADEDSDMDVFVEFETVTRELEERVSDIAWEVGIRHRLVITTLVFSREEIESSPLRVSPIVRSIQAEGIRI